jgi:hypothetical protein
MELVIAIAVAIGSIWLLSEGGDVKYTKNYDPPTEKKHRIGVSKVKFVRKRRT